MHSIAQWFEVRRARKRYQAYLQGYAAQAVYLLSDGHKRIESPLQSRYPASFRYGVERAMKDADRLIDNPRPVDWKAKFITWCLEHHEHLERLRTHEQKRKQS